MAGAAIARILLGLAVKGLKKSKPKKVVKKPNSAKATKTSAADDAKAKKIRATRTRVIDKPSSVKKSPNATKVEYKVTRAGKRPVTTAKKVAIAAVAAAAGNVRGPAGKSVKVKGGTKPVKWRNSKRVGRTKVASKLRSEYNPKTDQWIKYTD